jgi:hypothetical protein
MSYLQRLRSRVMGSAALSFGGGYQGNLLSRFPALNNKINTIRSEGGVLGAIKNRNLVDFSVILAAKNRLFAPMPSTGTMTGTTTAAAVPAVVSRPISSASHSGSVSQSAYISTTPSGLKVRLLTGE